MPSDLTGTVTSSHDPKPPELPPLPEAIVLVSRPGHDSWTATESKPESTKSFAKSMQAKGYATRIVTIQPPPSAREVSDAEVCEIIRDAWTKEQGIECVTADAAIARDFPILFACVRAALKGAAHAK